ncbi:hypothetical protein MIN45_P1078 [Methylomarinovum tepidoasis]|uniref:DUF1640 domain-containing protein n=2 Tax=Methylomarinovum tepidoasis TaxID=2840183 RepID=A0AAU9CX27_9GAMM|nr:hypothetical protein MIN45_P1078 [Methylomarinovum sp. IN45]
MDGAAALRYTAAMASALTTSDVATIRDLERLEQEMNLRFEQMERKFGQRLVEFDAKYEQQFVELESRIDTRLTDLEKRFEKRSGQIESQLRLHHWMLSLLLAGVISLVLKAFFI